jgi:hypothetical protein
LRIYGGEFQHADPYPIGVTSPFHTKHSVAVNHCNRLSKSIHPQKGRIEFIDIVSRKWPMLKMESQLSGVTLRGDEVGSAEGG